MCRNGKNLSEDILNIVFAGHKSEGDRLHGDLLAEVGHFDTKVPVPISDDMIGHHCNARLVVFEKDG